MGYNPIIKNKIKKPVKDNYNENRWGVRPYSKQEAAQTVTLWAKY